MTPEQTMASRIAEIVEYATGGNQAQFARIMGCSRQHIHNLISGTNPVGISTLQNLITKFPELSARWLLMGEGNMIDSATHILRTWFALEEYIPVMTPEERTRIDNGGGYTLSDLDRWKSLLSARRQAINERFERAYAKLQK